MSMGDEPAINALRHLERKKVSNRQDALAVLDDLTRVQRQLVTMRDRIGGEILSLNRSLVAARAYALPRLGRQRKEAHR